MFFSRLSQSRVLFYSFSLVLSFSLSGCSACTTHGPASPSALSEKLPSEQAPLDPQDIPGTIHSDSNTHPNSNPSSAPVLRPPRRPGRPGRPRLPRFAGDGFQKPAAQPRFPRAMPNPVQPRPAVLAVEDEIRSRVEQIQQHPFLGEICGEDLYYLTMQLDQGNLARYGITETEFDGMLHHLDLQIQRSAHALDCTQVHDVARRVREGEEFYWNKFRNRLIGIIAMDLNDLLVRAYEHASIPGEPPAYPQVHGEPDWEISVILQDILAEVSRDSLQGAHRGADEIWNARRDRMIELFLFHIALGHGYRDQLLRLIAEFNIFGLAGQQALGVPEVQWQKIYVQLLEGPPFQLEPIRAQYQLIVQRRGK